MKLASVVFAAATLFACSNKKSEPTAEKPPATSPTAGVPAPTETAPVEKSPTTPANAPANAGGDDSAGCEAYGALVVKCANGAGDAKGLTETCKATIAKNNAMTESMKAQVKCATTNADCDGYNRCLAGVPVK